MKFQTERNPERIPEILAKIEEFWSAHPDWRFGQLVENIYRLNMGESFHPSLFNIEDEAFVEKLERFPYV